MTAKEESDELFEMVGNDPDMWLEQARWLKTSAQLSWNELVKVYESNPSPSARSNTLIGLFQSYMLLTGFSFENLIKGIIASRNPGKMVVNGKLNTALWVGNGHEIAKIIPADIPLSDDEKELLSRLQIHTMWAGRYPTTMKTSAFRNERDDLSYNHSDWALAENLFFKLMPYVVDNTWVTL